MRRLFWISFLCFHSLHVIADNNTVSPFADDEVVFNERVYRVGPHQIVGCNIEEGPKLWELIKNTGLILEQQVVPEATLADYVDSRYGYIQMFGRSSGQYVAERFGNASAGTPDYNLVPIFVCVPENRGDAPEKYEEYWAKLSSFSQRYKGLKFLSSRYVPFL